MITPMRILVYTFAIALLVFGNVSPVTAQSQQNCPPGSLCYTPLEPLPGVDQSGKVDFAKFLSGTIRLFIALGALFAVATLVWYGIVYMTSAATGEKGRAKERMLASIYGLILLIASVLILRTINPELVRFDLSRLDSAGDNSYTSPNPPRF